MPVTEPVRTGADGTARCWWCGDDPMYVDYHDNEWGRPVTDADRLFEKICLEGFQAGLAWITVLRKRENFREAFDGFTVDSVARMGEKHVENLLTNTGIIRHRGKIEATLNNARCARDMRESGIDLVAHVWSFAPRARFGRETQEWPVTTSPSAIALSKDLKKRGWKFVGPTTVYSFMQSMGLVNDHFGACHAVHDCETEREAALTRVG